MCHLHMKSTANAAATTKFHSPALYVAQAGLKSATKPSLSQACATVPGYPSFPLCVNVSPNFYTEIIFLKKKKNASEKI